MPSANISIISCLHEKDRFDLSGIPLVSSSQIISPNIKTKSADSYRLGFKARVGSLVYQSIETLV